MVAFSKPVLFVGNDPMLSKATAEVLKSAGFKVRTTNPRNIGHVIAAGGYIAVVLCATLESAEATQAIEAAERRQPGVPIVSVRLGLLGDGPPPEASVIVDALNGPEALVQAVRSVTTQRKAAS